VYYKLPNSHRSAHAKFFAGWAGTNPTDRADGGHGRIGHPWIRHFFTERVISVWNNYRSLLSILELCHPSRSHFIVIDHSCLLSDVWFLDRYAIQCSLGWLIVLMRLLLLFCQQLQFLSLEPELEAQHLVWRMQKGISTKFST